MHVSGNDIRALGPGIDLHLGTNFATFDEVPDGSNSASASIGTRQLRRFDVPYGKEFSLPPLSLLLAVTREYLKVPKDLTGHIVGTSETVRIGLACATASVVSPGFTGPVTLEIFNHAPNSIRLSPGSRAASIVFRQPAGPGSPNKNAEFIGASLRSRPGDPLYAAPSELIAPPDRIIVEVAPRIALAEVVLAEQLRNHPEAIHTLSPREFEYLVAELLRDRGFHVEVTSPTRDGGKDLLAYLDTAVGTLLCLVEAKRYRADRPVGVELVRSLYGTLCDAKANSAMLVTTSSFTVGAREFQRRHEYQLSLRDYRDLVEWLDVYGKGPRGRRQPR